MSKFEVLSSLLGNMIVVIVVVVDKTMHTATNFFLASMSFSDIVFIGFAVPLNIYILQTGGVWNLGTVFCSLFWYLMYVSVRLPSTCKSVSFHNFRLKQWADFFTFHSHQMQIFCQLCYDQ